MVSAQIAALVAVLSATGETALLDFHATWCAPCRAMESTIAELERAGYPVRRVNVDHERRLARQYDVHSVPCFVLVVDGREVARCSGAVEHGELVAMFDRAGVRRGSTRPATARAQSPDPPSPSHGMTPGAGPSRPRFDTLDAIATPGPATPARQANDQELINASVRLTISDPQGSSHGTGTLIDSRQGEALVLTCGHIFRDSQGQGQISIDLCAAGAPQGVSGRLISYDLKSDVALVSIRPGVPVRVAPVAPKGYQLAKGDRVITVGCNHGKDATAETSTITAVNKFRAPPNLSVAGLPVQGRSGGGLFSADGRVIGVCNAADPADNEGLYAALAVIQEELDEVGLATIYEKPSHSDAAAFNNVAHTSMPGPAAPLEVSQAVAQPMPARMGTLNGVDPAALAELANRADGAEVICIVRPLSEPQAKSEVIMLDRASSAFLKQLAVDRQAQDARHLTSLRSQTPPKREGR